MDVRSSDPAEFIREHWRCGFPWCDTCKLPALGVLGGLRHVSAERPYGSAQEQSDHVVSIQQWYNAPPEQRGPFDES